MLILRRRVYQAKEHCERVISRLDWKVEKADVLTDLFKNTTVDTAKPWVGKIERTEKTFELTQTAPSFSPQGILEGKFFGLFIHGQILDEGPAQSKIEIDFLLAWNSLLTLAMAYLFPILLTIGFLIQNNWQDVKNLTPWWLMFTIPGTLLLIYQLNRTEREIKELLGAY